MAVVQTKDKRLSKKEQFYKLLGQMLMESEQTVQTKKALAEKFQEFVVGITPPTKLLEVYDLKGKFTAEKDIVNLEIKVPEDYVPVSYLGDKSNATVKFVLTFRETK